VGDRRDLELPDESSARHDGAAAERSTAGLFPERYGGEPVSTSEPTAAYLRTALGIGALLVVLYSLIVLQQVLVGVAVALLLFVLYLLWRLVRELTRIADAVETDDERTDAGTHAETERDEDTAAGRSPDEDGTDE
jgi:hypothetical protein